MAQQETYGNWLGPPLAPTKRLVRQGGIYSVAGAMTPMGDFRPASPDSFEEDYDDVSLAESGRSRARPVADEDLQSQKSKGGTGLYILAGKPASPHPSQKGDPQPGGGRGHHRVTSVAVLYILVALSFVAWALLFALALVKYMEVMEELKLLRSNYSENQDHVRQELSAAQREQAKLRSGMRKSYQELQDMAALICKAIPDSKKCSVGWKNFGKSCYSFSMETMNWMDAQEVCADQGAHLVIIETEDEQDFLRENLNSNSTYWLGATDRLEEGNWLWTNGQQMSTSYWNTWDPKRDKEQRDCGSIGPGGIWNDDKCSNSNHWICEKSWHC